MEYADMTAFELLQEAGYLLEKAWNAKRFGCDNAEEDYRHAASYLASLRAEFESHGEK